MGERTNCENDKNYQNNTQYFDHVKQLFSTAQTSNINLSLSGGKEKSDYALTFSKLQQQSIIQGQLDRANLTSNVGFEIAKGLTIRSITQLVYSDNTTNPFSSGGAFIASGMYTWPFADFTQKDSDGHTVYKFGGAGTNSSNPLYAKEFQTFSNKTVDIIQNLNLHYAVNKILELDYKAGVNYQMVISIESLKTRQRQVAIFSTHHTTRKPLLVSLQRQRQRNTISTR